MSRDRDNNDNSGYLMRSDGNRSMGGGGNHRGDHYRVSTSNTYNDA